MPGLHQIEALVWDIGGTVFDWYGAITAEVTKRAVDRGVSVDAHAFAHAWRYGMFDILERVRTHDMPWLNADEMHRLTLDLILPDFENFDLDDQERDEMVELWSNLPAWPDAPAALERLRGRYAVTVLTVLRWRNAVGSSRRNGIVWDGILSCEFLGVYKPSLEAYRSAADLLGLEPQQTMMVAAHPGDLQYAAEAGMRTAYVHRPDEAGKGEDEGGFPCEFAEINARDFDDLADQLYG